MQALGLLPKQSWRPFTHLLDSRSCTARAVLSTCYAARSRRRTITSLSCASLEQNPLTASRTLLAWRRDEPPRVPSRSASSSRRKASHPSRGGVRPSNGAERPPESSRASFPLNATSPSKAIDPIKHASRDEPSVLRRPAEDDLTYIVHLHRNKRVIWSVIALFVTVYVLGLPVRDGSNTQEASESLHKRLLEVPKDGGTITRVMLPIVPAFASNNLAFQVKNWPPSANPASWSPFVTSMFAHGSIVHLGLNCFGFYQLSSYLMCTPIGISGTIAIWLFGGLAATQLSSYTQNSYAHGKAKWYSKLFQKDPVDPNPAHTLNTYNLGASGGLMAMLGTISVWRGRSLWGIPLIPIAIQARVVGLCVLAWDYYGNYNNSMDGIGHNTHLCGMGIGAAIALFGLRRGKYAKVWKIVVKP